MIKPARVVPSVVLALATASCSSDAPPSQKGGSSSSAPTTATALAARPPAPAPAAEAAPAPAPVPHPAGIYAAATGGLSPSVADIPPRVYVPNSDAGTVSVIDPATYEVIDSFRVGRMPHHVIPSWDMQTLYVLDTAGNTITPIDPRTSRPGSAIPVEDPYNLYFTPDGSTAVVVAERYRRLDLRNPQTWELIASIPIPPRGVNHADFSADGRFFYASCEFSGYVVKVDLATRQVVSEALVGREPIDVKLSPDARVLFVADQARHGVMLLDPEDLHEIGFLETGRGAHGLYFSRDASRLFVSNRLGGTVSVVDVASRAVTATWDIPGGGSPDMGGVSADGSRLWLSGRHHGEAYVLDTSSGSLVARIPTGGGAHGLAVYPQPGNYSLGHTGVFR